MNMRVLPTALTCARFAAAPIVAGLIIWGDSITFTLGASIASAVFALALGLFALAAITDAADGMLARRLGATSTLGAALDHAADKALTTACLLALSVAVFPPDLVAAAIILIVRDAAVGGLREGLALSGRALPAMQSGKIKTTLILAGIGAALLHHALLLTQQFASAWDRVLGFIVQGALWLAVLFALWSAFLYVRAAAQPMPEV